MKPTTLTSTLFLALAGASACGDGSSAGSGKVAARLIRPAEQALAVAVVPEATREIVVRAEDEVGRVLRTRSVAFAAEQRRLEVLLDQIPAGSRRVIVVEGRDSTSAVVFYGRAEGVRITDGATTPVDVSVIVPPGREDPATPDREMGSIRVIGTTPNGVENGLETITATLAVGLQVVPPAGAVGMRLANGREPSFTGAFLALAETLPWTLAWSGGADGERCVSIEFQDQQGYRSPALSACIDADLRAPEPPFAPLVTILSAFPGSDDSVEGGVRAVEAGTEIAVYDDPEASCRGELEMIGRVTATADGRFGPVSLGDDEVDAFCVVVTDAAGHESAPLLLWNDREPPFLEVELVNGPGPYGPNLTNTRVWVRANEDLLPTYVLEQSITLTFELGENRRTYRSGFDFDVQPVDASTFYFDLELTPNVVPFSGAMTMLVAAIDAAGLLGTGSTAIIVDYQPPVPPAAVEVEANPPGTNDRMRCPQGCLEADAVKVFWEMAAEDNCAGRLPPSNASELAVAAGGQPWFDWQELGDFHVDDGVAEGGFVCMWVEDLAGNIGPGGTIINDVSAPTVTELWQNPPLTNDRCGSIHFEASEPLSTLACTLRREGVVVASGDDICQCVQTACTLPVDLPAASAVAHYEVVVDAAVDLAGNASSASLGSISWEVMASASETILNEGGIFRGTARGGFLVGPDGVSRLGLGGDKLYLATSDSTGVRSFIDTIAVAEEEGVAYAAPVMARLVSGKLCVAAVASRHGSTESWLDLYCQDGAGAWLREQRLTALDPRLAASSVTGELFLLARDASSTAWLYTRDSDGSWQAPHIVAGNATAADLDVLDEQGLGTGRARLAVAVLDSGVLYYRVRDYGEGSWTELSPLLTAPDSEPALAELAIALRPDGTILIGTMESGTQMRLSWRTDAGWNVVRPTAGGHSCSGQIDIVSMPDGDAFALSDAFINCRTCLLHFDAETNTWDARSADCPAETIGSGRTLVARSGGDLDSADLDFVSWQEGTARSHVLWERWTAGAHSAVSDLASGSEQSSQTFVMSPGSWVELLMDPVADRPLRREWSAGAVAGEEVILDEADRGYRLEAMRTSGTYAGKLWVAHSSSGNTPYVQRWDGATWSSADISGVLGRGIIVAHDWAELGDGRAVYVPRLVKQAVSWYTHVYALWWTGAGFNSYGTRIAEVDNTHVHKVAVAAFPRVTWDEANSQVWVAYQRILSGSAEPLTVVKLDVTAQVDDGDDVCEGCTTSVVSDTVTCYSPLTGVLGDGRAALLCGDTLFIDNGGSPWSPVALMPSLPDYSTLHGAWLVNDDTHALHVLMYLSFWVGNGYTEALLDASEANDFAVQGYAIDVAQSFSGSAFWDGGIHLLGHDDTNKMIHYAPDASLVCGG